MRKLWVVALVGLAACAVHEDDGFRASLAAGCHSEADCQRLRDEADRRVKECFASTTPRIGQCSEEIRDSGTAGGLYDQRQRDEARSARTAKDAEAKSARATFAAAARKRKAEETAANHEDCVAAAERQLQYRLTMPASLRDADLDKLAARVADVRARAAADAQCDDADADAKRRAEAEAWAADADRQIGEERTCRATPASMGGRIAERICKAIENRRYMASVIARERANPSGYVDKVVLHDGGQQIQDDDDEIREASAEYRKTTGRAFDQAACARGTSAK